jgi:hypothetical protein
MSKGTKIFSVRLPESLMDLIVATCALRGVGMTGIAWSVSDFLRIAAAEKVLKMDRSRGRSIDDAAFEARRVYLSRCKGDENAPLDAILDEELYQSKELEKEAQ